MREDRLRALRGIRFAARFGFTIEPVTWQAIVTSAPHLTRLSRERVKHNLDQIGWRTMPATEPTTLDYFMDDYVGHLEHHLRQVLGPTWYDEPSARSLP